jgi:aspartate racemase
VPLLIQSDPRIAPRPDAILGGGQSPLPELLAGRDRLIAAGATALAMPCNTAHFWFADLVKGCSVPFISIVDASCAELAALAVAGQSIGIIATRATLAAKIFDAPLQGAGYIPLLPDDDMMHNLVLPGIDGVKAGQAVQGGQLIEQAVQALMARGASAVVLACTETPLALDAVQSSLRAHCVDTTAALARACVAWWQADQAKNKLKSDS